MCTQRNFGIFVFWRFKLISVKDLTSFSYLDTRNEFHLSRPIKCCITHKHCFSLPFWKIVAKLERVKVASSWWEKYGKTQNYLALRMAEKERCRDLGWKSWEKACKLVANQEEWIKTCWSSVCHLGMDGMPMMHKCQRNIYGSAGNLSCQKSTNEQEPTCNMGHMAYKPRFQSLLLSTLLSSAQLVEVFLANCQLFLSTKGYFHLSP